MSQLISDFLDFSKFDAQEYTPILAPFNIAEEIQKNIETEALEAEKKQIAIALELPVAAIPTVMQMQP